MRYINPRFTYLLTYLSHRCWRSWLRVPNFYSNLRFWSSVHILYLNDALRALGKAAHPCDRVQPLQPASVAF